MRKLKKIAIILSIIFFTSCKKEMTDLEFEKNVMTEIFPSLIDSTCVDARIFSNPPPRFGKSIFDKTGHYIGTDSTKATQEEIKNLKEWKDGVIKIKNDTSKIIIAFNPVLKRNTENVKENFEKYFPKIKILESKTETNTEYRFEYQKIKLKNKFKIKDISEFPENRDLFWETKRNFIFSGVVDFTRIQFDKTKNFGILDGGYKCGRLCGQGFRIYIKKENNKWVIDKIEGTWIS
jgi:hypothetical protein